MKRFIILALAILAAVLYSCTTMKSLVIFHKERNSKDIATQLYILNMAEYDRFINELYNYLREHYPSSL